MRRAIPVGALCAHAILGGQTWGQSPVPATRLSIMWQVRVGGWDYMTSTLSAERNLFPCFGEIAYIRADTSIAPLYRLYNGVEHLDSMIPLPGYRVDGPLGSPWTTRHAVPGLAPLLRVREPATGDHATIRRLYPIPGYNLDLNFRRFGYPRDMGNGQILEYYSGGGITEGSDLNAGGAVASWSWNGQQFINTHDYGRYMQADAFIPDPTAFPVIWYNPNEAGDQISGDVYPPGTWHGSPTLTHLIKNGTHVTRSIPLDWNLFNQAGNSDSP